MRQTTRRTVCPAVRCRSWRADRPHQLGEGKGLDERPLHCWAMRRTSAPLRRTLERSTPVGADGAQPMHQLVAVGQGITK